MSRLTGTGKMCKGVLLLHFLYSRVYIEPILGSTVVHYIYPFQLGLNRLNKNAVGVFEQIIDLKV